ncbi:2Fe-2S iron-sulfur cluster-binding protein [Pseudonocardia aurantiaca]|uniref:2Fe-2S iron-sulfur cluster-binding protein n=1 Tax=Pseudonocardia aurantiaca TaxID=75290 RepID=A0ABW4FRZ5_9PSEU
MTTPEPAGVAAPAGYRLVVREVVAETADAHSVVFEVPAEHAERFRYAPGQFLTMRVPAASGGAAARCYSLASAPELDDHLTVTVKRVAGGLVSNWICDNLQPGHEVDVLPPAGRFTPRSLEADLLLFAGGSGITPIMSIVRSVLERGSGSVVLVYANRDERSVIFADRLRELADKHPDRLTVLHLLESVEGLPTVARLRALAAPFAGRAAAFVCGPAPFMDAVTVALDEAGMPRDRVVVERFLSLATDPFAKAPAARADPDTAADPDAARLTVTIDGERRELTWPRGTPLLDLLRGAGLDAPFSCREGACSACACRVESGELTMTRNDVLEQEDLDEGWVLACQAHPVTDEVEVTYD